MPRKLEFDRDAAVQAAADTFWEKGYTDTSLDDLTERLGIGRASLYNAFQDKRNLLLEALALYSDSSRNFLNEALASPKKGKEALSEFLHGVASCEGKSEQGCLCITVGVELKGEDPEIKHAIVANIARMEDTFFALLKRGQGDGSIKAKVDARKAAQAVSALVIGIHSMKRIGIEPAVMLGAVKAQLDLL